MGLSVSRPARLAVSSPKASATAPWETSCRITDGMSDAEVDDVISERGDLVARGSSTATSATPAMIQMVARGLQALAPGGGPGAGGSPGRSPGGPDQCFAAQLMQYRAAGFASRRSGSMGCPQSSHTP